MKQIKKVTYTIELPKMGAVIWDEGAAQVSVCLGYRKFWLLLEEAKTLSDALASCFAQERGPKIAENDK